MNRTRFIINVVEGKVLGFRDVSEVRNADGTGYVEGFVMID